MNEAFLFVSTGTKVVSGATGDLEKVRCSILHRSLVVETPDLIGSGVMICNTILTSLFLVRNFPLVTIRFSNGEVSQATMVSKDEENNLAKLEEIGLSDSQKLSRKIAGQKFNVGKLSNISSPLLVTNVASKAPIIKVGGLQYLTRLCERKRDLWSLDQGSPKGVIGGAVWTIDGEFLGLSIGKKKASPFEMFVPKRAQVIDKNDPRLLPRVYALTAETVLNFAEKKL